MAQRLTTGAIRGADTRCLVVPEPLASLAVGTKPDGDAYSPQSDFILTVGRLEELIFDHTVRLIHPSKSGGTNQLDRQINRQN